MADPRPASPPVSQPAGHNALILVVERNPVVQRLEKYFLEQAGYAVEFVVDGLSALERAEHKLTITNKGVVVESGRR